MHHLVSLYELPAQQSSRQRFRHLTAADEADALPFQRAGRSLHNQHGRRA